MYRSFLRALTPAVAAAAGAVSVLGGSGVQAKASVFMLSEMDNLAEHPERFSRQQVYELTHKWTEDDGEDAAVLWRHARASYQLADEPDVVAAKGKREALLREALRAAREAVRLDGNDGSARRWYGTVLQAHSSFVGYKQQIADAFEVKAQWEQAVALNPDDASAHHLLGRWAFAITEMPWYQRTFAKTLFAEPPSSTYEEARAHFLSAERISPNWWKANQLYLGLVEQRLGHREEALRWLQSALRLPTLSTEDRAVETQALEALARLDAKAAAAARAEVAERAKAAAAAEAPRA